MVSTRKRAAAQEAASDSDDDAPQEVAAHSAREAHQQAAQARAAAAKQVAARKRARAAQRPVAKKLAAEEEEDAADAALDVLPDDVIAAVAGHNGFLVANVGQRVVGSTQQGVLHQTVHIARRARPLERRAGPVNVKVLSQEEQDVLHAAATKAASDFMAARMQRSKRCNSMLKQPGQIQAARRVGKPY